VAANENDGPCAEGCFPPAAELARIAENAQVGRTEAFVGHGDPEQALTCVHGTWRLGDVLEALAAESGGGCSGTTKAGEPCQGRGGDDGLCAAHKETPAA
jgi:hypothetical protein